MANIKVLMVEDHVMVRMGLRLVLEKAEGIELIYEATDGLEAVSKTRELCPDVVLMDIGLPSIDGIEACKKIREFYPDMKILMYTSRDNEDDVLAAFQAGATGYIMKGANEIQTANAIKAVSEGTGWIDPVIARIVLSNIQKSKPIINNLETETMSKINKNIYGLTERETEVLSLIVEGLSNQDIADELCISKATAKAHVHNILQKLNIEGDGKANRTKAANIAVKEGLI